MEERQKRVKKQIQERLEQPHPTDVGWGFHGLAPVKPR